MDTDVKKNVFDGYQWCLCRPGQKVGSMKSEHDNHKEDRQWELKCQDIPGFTPNYEPRPPFLRPKTIFFSPTYTEDNLPFKTTIENDWDAKIEWDGRSTNSFLVGMTSYHNNHHEDRKFTFFYSRSDSWYLDHCHETSYQNEFDGELDLKTEPDNVIAGLSSYHSSHREDRRWTAIVCKLKYDKDNYDKDVKPTTPPTCADVYQYRDNCLFWSCHGSMQWLMKQWCPKRCGFCK